MKLTDVFNCWLFCDAGKVEAEADFNVLQRQVVAVDQHLANLVGGIGVFALVRIVVLKQEVAVAVFDDRPGVGLDFIAGSR